MGNIYTMGVLGNWWIHENLVKSKRDKGLFIEKYCKSYSRIKNSGVPFFFFIEVSL